jgi:anaerobic selenocysteine-containing dehydrogenase
MADYPLARVAEITGLPEADIAQLAKLYAEATPALIKIADGLQRNFNGGQNVRAICALPALTGQYGRRGGGLAYSTSGYVPWDGDAIHKWAECPPPGRKVNMNRLGAALLGEASDPPIQSLFVFGSNPAAIAPNAGRVVEGLRREDLFTVVHELFLTDTADFADIVLPATSQLEHTDLHKAYGHTYLTYNHPAIPPLGECKSNWDVMKLLAAEMGFTEPWLQQSPDEVLDEVLTATAVTQPQFAGITLDRLKNEGTIPLTIDPDVPFADGRFPTPSGKVELYSQTMADMGLDPLPGWHEAVDSGGQDGAVPVGPFHKLVVRFHDEEALTLISPASHHFTTSTFANQDDLVAREGEPFVEIHPEDAANRDIQSGDLVRLENGRGWCNLRAKVTDGVRRGVVASPKGRWSKWGDGRTINWLTTDALGDMAGQSTFHSSRVWLRRVKE